MCPIRFDARRLDGAALVTPAELRGTIPRWDWIGDEGAATSSS